MLTLKTPDWLRAPIAGACIGLVFAAVRWSFHEDNSYDVEQTAIKTERIYFPASAAYKLIARQYAILGNRSGFAETLSSIRDPTLRLDVVATMLDITYEEIHLGNFSRIVDVAAPPAAPVSANEGPDLKKEPFPLSKFFDADFLLSLALDVKAAQLEVESGNDDQTLLEATKRASECYSWIVKRLVNQGDTEKAERVLADARGLAHKLADLEAQDDDDADADINLASYRYSDSRRVTRESASTLAPLIGWPIFFAFIAYVLKEVAKPSLAVVGETAAQRLFTNERTAAAPRVRYVPRR
jgi:hypothetical protein